MNKDKTFIELMHNQEPYPDEMFEEAERREAENRKIVMSEDIPWTQYSIDDAERMKHPIQNPDEIVLEDVKMFHLESMNERSLWVGIYTQDGKTYHLNISAVGDKLSYWWSDETCD